LLGIGTYENLYLRAMFRVLVRLTRMLLSLTTMGFVACAGDRPDTSPNVVLVTLDTTRVDRLGPYGSTLGITPHLDQLAGESTVYERAYSTSSWTLPAHASLFTGKFPSSHGARLDPEGPLSLSDGIAAPARFADLRARGLAQAEGTLAENLRDSGYTTAPWWPAPG
jgi:arylsulfatase A-like enzyme